MRIWSLHPSYLDARGLVALWREALLAQAVLAGATRGYVHHPQLARFRTRPDPSGAIAEYLRAVHAESARRGYRFAAEKVGAGGDAGEGPIPVTRGQLEYEWGHLLAKVAVRDPAWGVRLADVRAPEPHPLFRVVPGGIEPWERV
jgi:hypothetical protein